jgi:opacity protein-like surface antigen
VPFHAFAVVASLAVFAVTAPSAAAEDEHVVVIEDADAEWVEVTEYHHHHHGRHWGGVHFGTVLTPYRVEPGVRPTKRVTSNQARACLDPLGERWCGNVRGFDTRFNFFHADDATDYPRWQGYFRSGYTTGRLDFEPSDTAAGWQPGEARSLSYFTVPLFVGGHVYLLKRSPVRPYGGMGFGFDVLEVQYAREQQRPRTDVSARIGFELHAGVEARITNWVTLNAEVMQLWSARRRLPGVPDFSNEGLTFMVGVSVNFPVWRGHHHVKKVRRVKAVHKPTRIRVEVRETPEEESPNPMGVLDGPAPPPADAEPAPPVAAEPAPPVAAEPAPPAAEPAPPAAEP